MSEEEMEHYPDTIEVHVTADDIKSGRRFASRACPVALAMHRAVGNKWGCVSVHHAYPFADEHEEWPSPAYYLTETAVEFVASFDGKKPVKPFKFTLRREVPKETPLVF